MNRHIVVAASPEYRPGLLAFLNSYEKHHPIKPATVHVLMYDWPESLYEELKGRDIVRVPLPHVTGVKGWDCKAYRFKYASELPGVVMLADADMFFLADCTRWFDVAAHGFIVAGANGSVVGFTGEHIAKYGFDVPKGASAFTITSVPTILRTDIDGDLWAKVYEVKAAVRECDFILQNVLLRSLKKTDRVILLSAQQVTGIHHFQLKPNTRIVQKEGIWMTEDGMPAYMCHGKWWSQGWRDNLMVAMTRFARGDANILRGAEASRALLYAAFQGYCNEASEPRPNTG